MRALELINKLAAAEAALRGQAFLAPLAGDGRARVRVGGLVYELAVRAPAPGWWLCRATGPAAAVAEAEAPPWLRGDYLALWPALRLVLLEPAGPAAWLALPLNPSDVRQRFGLAGPLLLRLVEGGQPFERVLARVDGAVLWYDDVDRRADPATAEALRAALAAHERTPDEAGPRLPNLTPGERMAYELLAERSAAARAAAARRSTERRLSQALAIGGARLLGYQDAPGGYRVAWERDGVRSVTFVDAGLSVVSAGICLSGEDHRFDLASIVGVVREAPDFARHE